VLAEREVLLLSPVVTGGRFGRFGRLESFTGLRMLLSLLIVCSVVAPVRLGGRRVLLLWLSICSVVSGGRLTRSGRLGRLRVLLLSLPVCSVVALRGLRGVEYCCFRCLSAPWSLADGSEDWRS